MKRTTVFADEEDLAVLREAAQRRGVAEAELIREGIRLAAMANRRWTDPFFSRTYPPTKDESYDDVIEATWDEAAEQYEATRSRP